MTDDLVERHQAKIEAITGACSCHDGFKSRGLIAPDCMFHECSHDIAELFDRIEALEAALRDIVNAPLPPHIGPAHQLQNIARRAISRGYPIYGSAKPGADND